MYEISAITGSERMVFHKADFDDVARVSAGKFLEEVNAIPSFEFTIFPDNPAYSGLRDRLTQVQIRNTRTNELEFDGVLINSSEKND